MHFLHLFDACDDDTAIPLLRRLWPKACSPPQRILHLTSLSLMLIASTILSAQLRLVHKMSPSMLGAPLVSNSLPLLWPAEDEHYNSHLSHLRLPSSPFILPNLLNASSSSLISRSSCRSSSSSASASKSCWRSSSRRAIYLHSSHCVIT